MQSAVTYVFTLRNGEMVEIIMNTKIKHIVAEYSPTIYLYDIFDKTNKIWDNYIYSSGVKLRSPQIKRIGEVPIEESYYTLMFCDESIDEQVRMTPIFNARYHQHTIIPKCICTNNIKTYHYAAKMWTDTQYAIREGFNEYPLCNDIDLHNDIQNAIKNKHIIRSMHITYIFILKHSKISHKYNNILDSVLSELRDVENEKRYEIISNENYMAKEYNFIQKTIKFKYSEYNKVYSARNNIINYMEILASSANLNDVEPEVNLNTISLDHSQT